MERVFYMSSLLVLMAHGSRDPRWREPFETLHKDLNRSDIRLCYMEFVGPTLADVVKDALETQDKEAPITDIRVLPLFWSAGSHVSTDIQELCAELRNDYPDLKVEQLPPIGEHPQLQSLLRELIHEMNVGHATNLK